MIALLAEDDMARIVRDVSPEMATMRMWTFWKAVIFGISRKMICWRECRTSTVTHFFSLLIILRSNITSSRFS